MLAISRLSPQAKAYLALLVLAFIWGYNWVAMRIAVQYAGPVYFAALRLTLSGIGLLGLLLWLKKPLKPAEIRNTALSGAFQLAGFYGFSAWAMVSGGAGKTAVLAYGMPFWVIFLAWPVLGEKLRRLQWLSVALALAGLFCILMPLRMSEELFSKGLALLSGMSWAVGVVISRGFQKRVKADLLSYTAWQTMFACIAIAPFVVFGPVESINWSFPLVAALFYCVVPGSIVAWLLWFYALNRLTAGSVGLCALATPIIGVFFAWMQMGERPSAIEGIGMMLVVIALSLNALQESKGETSSGCFRRAACTRKSQRIGRLEQLRTDVPGLRSRRAAALLVRLPLSLVKRTKRDECVRPTVAAGILAQHTNT